MKNKLLDLLFDVFSVSILISVLKLFFVLPASFS